MQQCCRSLYVSCTETYYTKSNYTDIQDWMVLLIQRTVKQKINAIYVLPKWKLYVENENDILTWKMHQSWSIWFPVLVITWASTLHLTFDSKSNYEVLVINRTAFGVSILEIHWHFTWKSEILLVMRLVLHDY